MLRKLVFCFLVSILFAQSSHAAITSLDNVFVQNDVYASDFSSRLNRNFQQVLNGGVNSINSANITDDSLAESDMADEINPRIRTYEGAACEFVYTGLLPVTSVNLTTNTAPGTAYPRGYRINKGSSTAHTYTASKWTWVDLDQNGDFQYSEQAVGSATPSVASNSIRLARVSTDISTVLSVQDLRVTSCTNGPFSIIKDANGEATLSDVLANGNGGWENGLTITSKDSHSVYINPGTVYINGKYRTIAEGQRTTVDGAIVASSINGTSGLDTGSLAANTNYYIYGVADVAATTAITGVLSASPSLPANSINYRRLGEVSTDASAVFTSSDTFSVSYLGKIRQIKRVVTGALQTGVGTTPNDDTPPLITEGNEILAVPFTPVSDSSMLKLDISATVNESTNTGSSVAVAVFQDNIVQAIGVGTSDATSYNGNSAPAPTAFSTWIKSPGKNVQRKYTVRAGCDVGPITVNGTNSARKYGGTLASSLTISEYDQ